MQANKKILIELDGSWVLKHRNDDKLPVAAIKDEFLKSEMFTVEESSLTSISVLYSDRDANFRAIKTLVTRFFKTLYPEEDPEKILSFRELKVEKEDAEKEKSAESGDTDPDKEELEQRRRELLARLSRELDGLADGEEDDEEDDDENSDLFGDSDDDAEEEGAIDRIRKVVGALEFKALAEEIVNVADEIKRTKTYEVFNHRCYLFSIGDGCGLTTYLELLARLIAEEELCRLPSLNAVREERLGAYREGPEPFEHVYRALNGGNANSPKLLCIDISEWLDKTDNRLFKQFLRAVEKRSEEFIVVFRVPFVDKDVLARIKYSLSDLLSVKAVSFPPLSQDEIKQYAEEELNKYDFSVTKSAWKYFFERIQEEKSDGKFYGINSVKKVVRELVYQKCLANSFKERKSKQVSANDAKKLCEDFASSTLSGMEMLDKLVGVDGVKKRVEEIISQIELSLKDPSVQRPCIHMRFVGNPGTGKTTVARILGKILKEKGVLRVGAFFEHAGRDFCGRYIGETAPKTASICRDAYGSVLFIDEAYSLYRGDGDTKDFGREAIDTLIAEMENHRNDFIVIMAGYTADMEKLMGGNAGLASRMPYTIEFPNFTREQLYDIYVSMVKNKFKYDKELFTAAHDFFINLPDEIISSKDFANARYVRNLFERTWAKAAMRCQLNGKAEVVLTRDDFDHASADKEFMSSLPKKTRIGF